MALQPFAVLARPGPWDDDTVAQVTDLGDHGWFFCETEGCPLATRNPAADLVMVAAGEFYCPTHADQGG